MRLQRRDMTFEQIELLRRTESDAAESCRRAAAVIVGDPLTRGTVLAFALEHDEQAAAWGRVGTTRAEPMETGLEPDACASSTTALSELRRQAELAVRRYGEAMERLPPPYASLARTHRNVWLRQRAWLGARLSVQRTFGRDSAV